MSEGGGCGDLQHEIQIFGFIVIFVSMGMDLSDVLGQEVVEFRSIGSALFIDDLDKERM